MSATATRIMPPATTVSQLTRSPRTAAPRMTATSGLTYAYVDAAVELTLCSNQMYAE